MYTKCNIIELKIIDLIQPGQLERLQAHLTLARTLDRRLLSQQKATRQGEQQRDRMTENRSRRHSMQRTRPDLVHHLHRRHQRPPAERRENGEVRRRHHLLHHRQRQQRAAPSAVRRRSATVVRGQPDAPKRQQVQTRAHGRQEERSAAEYQAPRPATGRSEQRHHRLTGQQRVLG